MGWVQFFDPDTGKVTETIGDHQDNNLAAQLRAQGTSILDPIWREPVLVRMAVERQRERINEDIALKGEL